VGEFANGVRAARDDDELRGVILTGAGDKAFIAGADINELARLTPSKARVQQLWAGSSQSH